jgi:hypothetical protein
MDYSHLSNITKNLGKNKNKNSCTYMHLFISYQKITCFPTYLFTCLQDLSDLKSIIFLGLMLDGWLVPNCVGFSLLGIELNK